MQTQSIKWSAFAVLVAFAVCQTAFSAEVADADDCEIEALTLKTMLRKRYRCSGFTDEESKLANDLQHLKEDISSIKDMLQNITVGISNPKIDEEIEFKPCPDNGTGRVRTLSADEMTYFFSYPKKMSWTESKQFCERNNMYMVKVQNQSQLDGLFDESKRIIDHGVWWLGASDIEQRPGKFKWIDGEQLLPSNTLWDKAHGNPRNFNAGQETCVSYFTWERKKLVDLDCKYECYVICKVKPECLVHSN
ncbi:uncharacterized protein LOC135940559 [Cloeon dipterum]|uniref:uncharacterized protein LOC135940559 n=1 Tax=Cloeon dipterum TaxID=197152 RepID=UPI00321F756C